MEHRLIVHKIKLNKAYAFVKTGLPIESKEKIENLINQGAKLAYERGKKTYKSARNMDISEGFQSRDKEYENLYHLAW